MAFDCDCGWERELDAWGPPPPPPTFDLPPPPVPPSLIAATTAAAAASDAALFLDDLCSDDAPSQDTCQAFLVGRSGEYQVPTSAPVTPFIVGSAAVLTTILIVVVVLLWRYRKQKKQQKSPRYPKSLASPFDAPVAVRAANGVGESGALVDDAVLYDELLSYAPAFRNNHSMPPAYEMRDVLKSPCHCSTYPLLGNQQQQQQQPQQQQEHHHHQHYVATPYHCAVVRPRNQQSIADQQDWINEPVYEELPSGAEDDKSSHSAVYCSPERRINYSFHSRPHFQRGGSGSSSSGGNRRSPWSGDDGCGGGQSGGGSGSNSTDVRETDFFLAPASWTSSYRYGEGAGSVSGQLTADRPVRAGTGGVRAAWREVPSLDRPGTAATVGPQPPANKNRKKRQKSSKWKPETGEEAQRLMGSPATHLNSLYRGRCPPEPPPFSTASFLDDDVVHDANEEDEGVDGDSGSGSGSGTGSGSGSGSVPESAILPQQNGGGSIGVRTLPRYYYYSENDDYGVTKQPGSASMQRSSLADRRSQRHLQRNTRTRQAPVVTQGV